MKDEHKTKEQLISELVKTRQRMVELAASEAERKKAEEALRESEERYRALFEQKLEGVLVIGETMKVLLANQAAADMFGFDSVEEALEVNMFDYIAPEERERALKIITEDMFEKDLRQINEFRTITKDGREIWISAIGVKTEYQGRLAGLVSFRDITEQKRVEEALKESEENLRTYLESAPDGVYLNDLKGTFLYGNKKAAGKGKTLGYMTPGSQIVWSPPASLASGRRGLLITVHGP